MNFQTKQFPQYCLISISAEKLDSKVSPDLKSELVVLESNGAKNIIIDLSSTRYCDSSGLSAILIGNRLCKTNGGLLVLCNPQESVKKVISISKLDTVLCIKDTMAEAEAMF